MALFSEYAVTPGVFNLGCYKSRDLGKTHIGQLQQVFLAEGLVRDLHNGAWRKFLLENDCDKWVKDVLKNLKKNGRLVSSNPELSHTPQTDREWYEEALKSDDRTSLNGIIVSDTIEKSYKDAIERSYKDATERTRKKSLVSSVNKLLLPYVKWWSPIDNSLRLNRTIKDYRDALKLIFRHAKSIMFIDPYIDPEHTNYADFIQLLEAAGNRPPQSPQLFVEIHRKSLRGSGRNAPLWDQQDMENTFRNKFGPILSRSNLTVKVFVWDDFHDRYLISDLVGIQMSNGFDTSTGPLQTIWSRIGRTDREDIERDFDANILNKRNPKCQFNFTIP